jgi:PAS domain S-box-containing protein
MGAHAKDPARTEPPRDGDSLAGGLRADGGDLLVRVVETMPAGLTIVDPEGHIVFSNAEADRILRLSRGRITSRYYNDAEWRITSLDGGPFPPEDLPFERVMRTKRAVYGVEHAIESVDGQRVLLSINAAPMLDSAGHVTAVVATCTDITERRHEQEQLRRSVRALTMLGQCNQLAARARDENEMLDSVCQVLVGAGGYRLAWVGLIRPGDDAKAVHPVAHAGFDGGYVLAADITWAETPRGLGPTGTAIRTGRPVVARDIHGDPQFAPWREDALARGYASSIALPLMSGGERLGALNVYAVEPDAFDGQEAELLSELADDIVFGLVALRARNDWANVQGALQQSEARYRGLFENAPISLWEEDLSAIKRSVDELRKGGITDLKGYFEAHPDELARCVASVKILDVNQATLDLFGATQKEELTSGLAAIFDEMTYSTFRERVLGISEGQRSGFIETTYRTLDGRTIDAGVGWRVAPGSEESYERATVFVLDMSERKRAERLQTDFTSAVSHELRSPLTAVMGFAAILERPDFTADQAELTHIAARIKERAQYMARLVENLMEAHRRQARSLPPKLCETDVEALMRQEASTTALHPGQTMTLDIQPDLPCVLCDPEQVRLALSNLLSNAIKFSPEGGEIELGARLSGDDICVTVTDHGVGVHADDMPRIFDRYYQADMTSTRAFGGVGLGLFLSQDIAQAHAGEITVESRLDEGSTFTLRLPVAGPSLKEG